MKPFAGAFVGTAAVIKGVNAYRQYKRNLKAQRAADYEEYKARRAIADKKASEKSATACNECDSYWENLGYNKLRNKMLTANEIKNYVVEKCAPLVHVKNK